MRRRVLVAGVVLLLVGVPVRASAGAGQRSASPFDGGPSLVRASGSILPAIPLDLSTDLSLFGVSSSELATVGPVASTDPDPNIVVGDKTDCPTATFTSIQAAVMAASPGARIRVCPGTYTEQVTIPAGKDGLILYASPDLSAVIKAPIGMVDPKAIVRVNGATNVTIRHFTITGPGSAPCDSLRYGVRVDAGGSALIESNRITLIQNTPFGCESTVAVLIGRDAESTVGTAEISHNLIDRYEKGAVVVDGAGSSGDVHHNRITGPGAQPTIAPNGIQVSRGARLNADHNVVSENSATILPVGTGILVLQAAANAVTVGYNEVFNNDDGISLYATNGALVEHNFSHDQRVFDGLFAFFGTSNNRFSYNRAERNVEHDCHDDSAGGGTAGTANFWDHDLGDTESRAGLCKATPPK